MTGASANFMATATAKSNLPTGTAGSTRPGDSLAVRLLKYAALMVLDAFVLILIYAFVFDSNLGLAAALGLVTLMVNVIVAAPGLMPLRWIVPGMALVGLLVLYPIFYTVTTAFTNYSNIGHPLPKEQAIQQIIRVGGKVPGDTTVDYDWGARTYEGPDGTYAVWLVSKDGTETLFVPQEMPAVVVQDAPAEPPAEFQGYTLLSRAPRGIQNLTFGTPEDSFVVKNTREISRGEQLDRYIYDAETDTLTDRTTGAVYIANDTEGQFDPQTGGPSLQPGYRVFIGFGNFTRLLNDPALSGPGPLLNIFVWTVAFAFLSVLTTFALGLIMAMIMNDPIIPARKAIRSILLIPYAIPGVISIVVWRGMLNQNLGIINYTLDGLFPSFENIPWLLDPFWGKFSLVLVNLWLGYPYMMLICSGALQSIPSEVYEASSVDGANPWQKFWNITLPLLLVAVGPLLIGSFVYNFNNYLLITALTGGNPPIAGSPIPGVGQTDILISYVYKSAFSNQADYGYASAITIIIFLMVAAITLIQYQYTRTWEQVSENV